MQEFHLGSIDKLDYVDMNRNSTPGMEYLMNDRKKNNIDLGEIDNIENELNELSGRTETTSKDFIFLDKEQNDTPKLGSATSKSIHGVTKSFDGFSKMNEIPMEYSTNTISDREKKKKKLTMLRKLEQWGVVRNYNIDTDYDEIEDEYEVAKEYRSEQDQLNVTRQFFNFSVSALEMVSKSYKNELDLDLDGWSDTVSEEIESYDDVFLRLNTRYSKIQLAPELVILGRLAFSAIVVNITNKSLSHLAPGAADILKGNPDAMKAFTKATVESMNAQSQGMNFLNNLGNQPPPKPLETKLKPPSERSSYRPDIISGRGGIDIRDNFENVSNSRVEEIGRVEMVGPKNIFNIENTKRAYKKKSSDKNMVSVSLDI